MTGVGMALAAGVTPGGSPPPTPPSLNISMTNSGGNPINVTGASGSMTVFSYSVTGGGGGYYVTAGADSMGSNPSGKLGQGEPANPYAATGSIDVTWGGLAVNETQYALFGCFVRDGNGDTDSAATGSIGVTRVS